MREEEEKCLEHASYLYVSLGFKVFGAILLIPFVGESDQFM